MGGVIANPETLVQLQFCLINFTSLLTKIFNFEFQDLPGPGYYEVGKKKEIISCYPKPLVSRAERFKDAVSANPDVGHYNPCDCFVRKRDFSISSPPFNSNKVRLVYGDDDSLGELG